MKGMNLLLGTACLYLLSCGPTYVVQQSPSVTASPRPTQAETSYQAFYDNLAPYGDWVNYAGYGYVFIPRVNADFKPYSTNGHWVYSNEGWVWASDYPWGWATFHYGRWFFDNAYGWIWVPGHEWAPAWVSWRRSDEYYGWAPLSPGINVNVSISTYNPPQHYWNFVPHQYVTNTNIHNYYVNESRNTTIVNNTTVINNTTIVNNHNTTVNNTINNNTIHETVYRAGPDAAEVSRASGTSLQPVMLSNSPTPGQINTTGQLTIYRPVIKPGNTSNGQSPAPPHLQELKNLAQRPAVAPVNTSPNPQSAPPAVNTLPKPVERPLIPQNTPLASQQPLANPGKPTIVEQPLRNKPTINVPQVAQQAHAPITAMPNRKNVSVVNNSTQNSKPLPISKSNAKPQPSMSKAKPPQKPPPVKQELNKKPGEKQ